MKILIAGTGDTALHLAKMLSRENQDVVVMGTDYDVLSELDAAYNVITYSGRADSISDQRTAGVSDCDLYIAVTPSGNLNIVSAEIAKTLGAKTTFVRIDNADLLNKDIRSRFSDFGIDKVVFPEYLAAKEIVSSITNVWADSLYHLSHGGLDLCSIKLRGEAPVIGMTLMEFGAETKKFHVSLIKRGGEVIIPNGTTQFRVNDEVYFTMLPGDGKELGALLGRKDSRIRNVLIAGAGKISDMLVDMLPASYVVKVIEPDKDKCRFFAKRHHSVTVVNADFRDNDVLREEGIHDECVFVSLADSSEANIVSAMVAKHMGASKTIAQIEDMQYFEEVRSLDIDTIINKKLTTSSRIYQVLLDNYLDSPRCLAFEDSEVVEIVISDNSPITKKRVRDLRLPSEMTIAGLIRGNKGMLVSGDSLIEAGDHVMVFCMHGSLRKIRKEFK